MAAKRRRNRRFQARDDRPCRPDILGRARHEVRAPGGAAGGAGVAAVISQRSPVSAGRRHSVQIGQSTMKLQQRDRDVWRRVRRLVRAKRGRRGPWKEPVFAAWCQGRSVAAVEPPGGGATGPRMPHAEGCRSAV